MKNMPKQLSETFHNLWSRDVGTPGYEKRKWRLLDRWLSELIRVCPALALPERFDGPDY